MAKQTQIPQEAQNPDNWDMEFTSGLLKVEPQQLYKVLARRNGKACKTCDGMDERIFQKKDAVAGENFPPFHPNCVCQAVDYDGNRLMIEQLELENKTPSSTIINYSFDGGTVWADNESLQGVGILPGGNLVSGADTDAQRLELARLVQLQAQSENPSFYQSKIDALAEQIVKGMEFYPTIDKDKVIETAEGKRQRAIQNIKSFSYYQIEDVTKKMAGLMIDLERKHQIYQQLPWAATIYPQFFEIVKKDSEIDVKNKEPFRSKSLFIYNGEIMDRDALGNLLYGYLGKVYKIPNEVLYMGAGYAQVNAGTSSKEWKSTYYDDPRDNARIKQGIAVYNDYHKKKLQ